MNKGKRFIMSLLHFSKLVDTPNQFLVSLESVQKEVNSHMGYLTLHIPGSFQTSPTKINPC